MAPTGPTHGSTDTLLGGLSHAVSSIDTRTLDQRIVWLRHNRADDLLQRTQSEAIVELYQVVRQIQAAMSGLVPIPGADAAAAARAAAERAAAAAAAARSATLTTTGVRSTIRRG